MPQRRKVVSCGTCRRLRTRCEKLPGLDICRRCDRLRIQCEFPVIQPCRMNISPALSDGASISHKSVLASQTPMTNEEPIRHIHQRLSVIETTLADLKGMITGSKAFATPLIPTLEDRRVLTDAQSPVVSESLEDDIVIEEDFSQTAAISVVRNMSHIILGTTPGSVRDNGSADCVTIGLVTESLCHQLFDGLRSLPLQRYGLDLDPWSIRHSSPLLFATYLLAGLYTVHYLCNSQLHVELFTHVEKMASKTLLLTPLSIESVQAFLILSVWDLTPPKFGRYIDSWLMSGMGIMHGMLCTEFPRTMTPPENRHSNMLKTWNLLRLTHLQFSVGTGQRPIVCQSTPGADTEYLADSCDEMTKAQSQLYHMLFELIVSRKLSLESLECRDIEHWRDQYARIIESDVTMGLEFAYSSAHLMFCRHLLKILTTSSPVLIHLNLSPGHVQARIDSLIDMVIRHCSVIMELYLTIATSEGNVTPAFNHMMCTSAAITVVEFKSRLKHSREMLILMKNLHQSIEQIGRNDKVIGWAVNVMEIAAREERTSNQ